MAKEIERKRGASLGRSGTAVILGLYFLGRRQQIHLGVGHDQTITLSTRAAPSVSSASANTKGFDID